VARTVQDRHHTDYFCFLAAYIRSLGFDVRVDEEDYGGHAELIMEGMPFAVGTFLVRISFPALMCANQSTMEINGC
jgi:hypothetical protein